MSSKNQLTKVFFKKYWLVFAGFFLLQIIFDQVRSLSFVITGKTDVIYWRSSILSSVTEYLLWAVFVVFLYRFYIQMKPILGLKGWAKLGLLILTAAFLHALIDQFLYLSSYELIFGYDDPFSMIISENLKFFLHQVFLGVLVVFFLLTMIAALDYYEQFKEERLRSVALESELSKSRLEALQAQLNPHFLFNALNTISMMVRGKKDQKAVSMISSLSDLLRTSLQMEAAQMIPLKEEIMVVKKYLEIEQERFSDRLSVEIDIPDDLGDCGVPNLILQPILENAFKYGVTENLDLTLIQINAKSQNDRLIITIENNGNTLPQGWNIETSRGIGLNNVEKRLSYLFNDYSFKLENGKSNDSVVATISIPKSYENHHVD